jgi:ATP-binding cassette, subfamily B, multidrug efflux pump
MTTVTPPAFVLKSEDQYTKGYDPKVVNRLVEFIRPYQGKLLTALFLMFVGSVVSVAGPYFVKIALDSGIAAANLGVLRQTMIIYLVAISIQWLAIYIRVNLMARVGQSIIYDLRSRLFEHLQALSLSFYSHYSVGRVITRVINDVGVLREFLTWAILAIARDFFTLIGIIIAMLSMNARLSLLTFAVLPVMVIATRIFRKRARERYRKVRSAISWVNSVLAENINGVRVVQAFSRQDYNYTYFRENTNRYHLDMSLMAARLAAVFLPTIDLLGTIATAIVVLVGGAAVLGESITPGVLVAFILYIDRFFEPIRDLSRRFDTFQSTMAGGERIIQLMETEIEVKDAPDAIDLPQIQGDVHFEGVSFHYMDDPTLVLKDIDLHVRPGETVALVGETGAGKSTLIKLVARFHDPTEGQVLIDGHDLRTVTQHSLRSQMGIVLQDPFLFNGTVSDNIRFGRLEASDDQVEAAARAVGAHNFITNLRDGYDSSVEEGGALLSVGQRQLISFARALLADPRILILDEATSSVDTQTERIIQEALARLLENRTAFVIAHRLSTVVNADRIAVINDGQIVEQGTHTELLVLGGEYFRLYQVGFEE